MDILIDSVCDVVPKDARLLISEKNIFLNFLVVLGYNPANPPFADLLTKFYKLEGEWVILSLVYWEATHNDVMIVAFSNELKLEEAESKMCFKLFSDYFAKDGKILHYHNAETWLLSNKQKNSLNAKPVHHLLHKSLMHELTHLDSTMYWQKFLTESQMLLASKPNRSLINGVWIWGNEKLSDFKKSVNICVDEQFYSLAQICSSRVTLYSPLVNIKEYHILLLTKDSKLSEQHQKELKKMSINWYWNNVAYCTRPDSWYARLGRKLIYAH